MSADILWAAVVSEIRKEAQPVAVKTWLDTAALVEIDAAAGSYALQVPSAVAKGRIDADFLPRIHALLGEALGEQVTVTVDVVPEVQAQRLLKLRTAPGAAAGNDVVDVELSTELALEQMLVPALMENNLARKAIWSTNPDKEQRELVLNTEDLVGTLQVHYSLGQLGVFDLQLVSWLLGRWEPDQDGVIFPIRECASQFKLSYSGRTQEWISDALLRIANTRFTGRVFDRTSGRHEKKNFGIIDTVTIVDKRSTMDGPPLRPGTVTLTFNSFLLDQLRARQFVRLDWTILRHRLSSALGKRLYVFVESQQGFAHATRKGVMGYEVLLDGKLKATLGVKDANEARFRAKLQAAGKEIMEADGRYDTVRLRAGKARGTYVLSVLRRVS